MDPVTAHVSIDRPREEVFEYLADIANHPEFSDHYLKEWRLTRVDSSAAAPARASRSTRRWTASRWGDMTFIEVERAAQDRRRRPRGQVQPQQDVDDVDADAVRATRRASRSRPSPSPRCRRTSSWRRSRAAAAGPSAACARRCAGMQSILEEDIGPRGSAPPSAGCNLRRRCVRKLVLLAVVAARSFAGCGDKTDYITVAETEGIYVDVGGLDLPGPDLALPEPGRRRGPAVPRGPARRARPQLPGDEIWFGVWMRVKNYTDETLQPTDEFMITDTEGNEYHPVPLDARRTRSPTTRSRCATRRCCRRRTRRRPAARSRAR